MATRILFFGDHDMMGNLYSLYLRSKGYEVLHFPLPATCALVAQNRCTCPRDHVCADLILADMEMEGLTGLELIRHQNERGCHVSPGNKAVLAMKFNAKQEEEIRDLGCIKLQKPFRLLDLVRWVSECEQNIPTDRNLTPHEELLEPAKDP